MVGYAGTRVHAILIVMILGWRESKLREHFCDFYCLLFIYFPSFPSFVSLPVQVRRMEKEEDEKGRGERGGVWAGE